MPGPWKPWKTRQRFPTASTAPWKSHTSRFPHSHSANDFSLSSKQKQTPHPSRPSDAQGKNKTAERRPLAASASAANRPLFRAHSALERKPLFRLIARWNQTLLSGSFLDWKMLSLPVRDYFSRTGLPVLIESMAASRISFTPTVYFNDTKPSTGRLFRRQSTM